MKDTSASQGKLKVLTLRDDVEPATPEFSSTGSWQGLPVKPDRKIEKLAAVRWADIDDSPSCPSSTTVDGGLPTFPPVASDAATRVSVADAADLTAGNATPSSSKVASPLEGEGAEEAPFETDGQEKPGLEVPKANFELEGWLPFVPYGSQATDSELPTASQLGAEAWKPGATTKLFFGHLPAALPTGVLQWLMETFVERGPLDALERPVVFEPQLHFKDGWFKGCAHALVRAPNIQNVIRSLHHRVLFDIHGVWYARTPSEVQILQQYCTMLRNLPQRLRHEKLQGLPCNPLACEITRNS